MPPLRLLLIAGARPNFMKVAPLIRAIHAHNARHAASVVPASDKSSPSAPGFPLSAFEISAFGQSPISYKLVHTGQHYDERMSEVFFRELGIPAPDVNLEVGSGSHAVQTANIMARFEPVLLHAFDTAPPASPDSHFPLSAVAVSALDKPPSSAPCPPSSGLPDWLIVVGDVNSTMACTLVASKLGVKVAHIEAGLRSRDRTMPEEINRLVTDALADLLLTPSEDANENLRREGVPEEKIKLVGNIMIDALVANLSKARASAILQQHNLRPGNYVYVTLHRPSNVDHPENLRLIMTELANLACRMPVVFPIHPRTRHRLAEFGISVGQPSALNPQPSTLNPQPRLLFLDPVGYHDSLRLTENARLVLTDSGGLQEESTWFRTPCLTLRPNTERPVTVTLGSNRLTTVDRLRSDIEAALNGGAKTGAIPPLWDGQTAERVLVALFGDVAG